MTDRFAQRLNKVLQQANLRETVRLYRQRQHLLESRRPQEGPYYWIPKPDGGWKLLSWYVEELGQDRTDHAIVWRSSGAPALAKLWGMDADQLGVLRQLPYCVPRGRVCRTYERWNIYHGGDSPVPESSALTRLCMEFNLLGVLRADPDQVVMTYDNHERTQQDDLSRLRRMLDRVQVNAQI